MQTQDFVKAGLEVSSEAIFLHGFDFVDVACVDDIVTKTGRHDIGPFFWRQA